MSQFLQTAALLLLLIPVGGPSANTSAADVRAEVDRIYALADEEVKERLSQLDASIVEHRYDASVRRRITNYVENWRSGSQRLLGRSAACFPYFSEQLSARGLPDALKYLTVAESALRPYALSHVGAAGYWQLMPGTARELGLEVSERIDERLDIVLGTRAGLDYLQRQYERYEDWALAMAAYNSGPGRVNRAKRKSGSNDYWKLRKYLPRETRGYVPSYIAAAYLMTYYSAYALQPERIDPDLQVTACITVNDFLSLQQVAQVTGLKPAVVIRLNPAYLAGYLPESATGRTLRLPQRVVPAMRQYLRTAHQPDDEPVLPWRSPLHHRATTDGRKFYDTLATHPASTDTAGHQLAAVLSLPAHQLLIWSGHGALDSVYAEQTWQYLRVRENWSYEEVTRPEVDVISPLPDPSYRLSDRQKHPRIPTDLSVKTAINEGEPTKGSSLKRLFSDVWKWISA